MTATTLPRTFPDLHSQAPAVLLPVQSVGHRGVQRPLVIDGAPAMVTIDVAVGLLADQRGAHMSRLIDCLPQSGDFESARDMALQSHGALREVVVEAASWSIEASATRLLTVPDGVKPIDELCAVRQVEGGPVTVEWGVRLKVCLACPQAQAGIAHDRHDEENVGMHPSHNQVCDLTVRITGAAGVAASLSADTLVEIAESHASGPVRERYKRRGEADCVTEVHHNARFAEDALRVLANDLRALCPDATVITCDIVNYESIFEYPLHCVVIA
jgi:GTP cyclohydrolase FolE2